MPHYNNLLRRTITGQRLRRYFVCRGHKVATVTTQLSSTGASGAPRIIVINWHRVSIVIIFCQLIAVFCYARFNRWSMVITLIVKWQLEEQNNKRNITVCCFCCWRHSPPKLLKYSANAHMRLLKLTLGTFERLSGPRSGSLIHGQMSR